MGIEQLPHSAVGTLNNCSQVQAVGRLQASAHKRGSAGEDAECGGILDGQVQHAPKLLQVVGLRGAQAGALSLKAPACQQYSLMSAFLMTALRSDMAPE